MSNNYPAPPRYAKPAKIPGAFRGVITGAGHSSIYLTPVQEERILNWREASTSSQPSRPKGKSSPASVRLSSNCSSCTCTCIDCQGGPSRTTSCCCSVHSPKSKTSHQSKKGKGPNSRVKSYYSRNTAPESSNMTPTLPTMMTVRPKAIPIGRQPPQIKANKTWAASRPSYEQISQLRTGPPQWTAPDASPMDITPLNTEIPMLRIAGSRDPISQSYWRRMFPPAMPTAMPAFGVLPPQVFGMPPRKP
ncbi:hypothetical protein AYX14_02314 [Cryptococcus neoformans]|nr:hypothetical protein AYX15_02046 [Cryptococcus neoformans var. grubii]OWZ72219.1 hypothetical protein AYX14_02314 [Cryptococcus neoformans var. grubii]OWZ77912.1 hypothetical protein C365_03671 [Cryptococcus neoformans var. grubii Bt85]